MKKDDLTIYAMQTDIAWEDKERNLQKLESRLRSFHDFNADIVALPEMFTTGFTTETSLAEPNDGITVSRLKALAGTFNTALTGSFLAEENGKFYNRAFFITPAGDTFFYDKRHLFVMSDEKNKLTPGNAGITIPYKGWNISLAICYDLRFPVWLRNKGNVYDLMIIPANWPKARITAWDILIKARAIENLCYVCGVNRVGKDAAGIYHNGASVISDFKGICTTASEDGEEDVLVSTLSKSALDSFREKFPAWKDAD